ncbi:MAG: hypothetical protein ABEJ04_00090 [Halobacteriaceae archaeon]
MAPVEPSSGGPLAFLGTFLLAWALFAFTAQVAATYLLGDVPWRRAVAVGVVPAVVNVALVRYSPAVIAAVALGGDFLAVHLVYRLRYRTAAAVTLLHAAMAVAFAVALSYLAALLGTAPG